MDEKEIIIIVYLLDLWFSLLISFMARCGNRDAFEFKKSNSTIKKQLKQMSTANKIFWYYDKDMTVFPFYRNLFYAVRISSLLFSIITTIFFLLSIKKINCTVIFYYIVAIREILLNIPFFLFALFHLGNDNKKNLRVGISKNQKTQKNNKWYR